MTKYVVKKIGKRRYIYFQRRLNGKVKTKYIGPLDRIVEFYIQFRDIIERLIEWCGGWDLNPRRPTPSGPKPDPFVLARAPPHSQKATSKPLL